MTFEVRILRNARQDIEHIRAWYAVEAPDQTVRFVEELTVTLDWIAVHGDVPAVDGLGLRRMSLKVFKYHAWYRIVGGTTVIQVLAVLHHSRDPDEIRMRAE